MSSFRVSQVQIAPVAMSGEARIQSFSRELAAEKRENAKETIDSNNAGKFDAKDVRDLIG